MFRLRYVASSDGDPRWEILDHIDNDRLLAMLAHV